MKKKVSSSLLMASMLAVGSTGMLVSCSEDYDDDIKNLQSQIDGLATADELNSRINEMSSAIEQAKNEAIEKANAANEVALAAQQAAANAANTAEGAQQVADAAKAKAEELEKNGATKAEVEAAQQAAAAAQAFAEQAKADADKALADLQAALDAAVKAAEEAVTKAQATADEAKTTAEDAKAAAEKAFEDAKKLIEQSEENAVQRAEEALNDAVSALNAAIDAQSDAVQNLTDALAAKADAATVAGMVDEAKQAAADAADAAKTAQETADEAKKDVEKALGQIGELASKLDAAATKDELQSAIDGLKSSIESAKSDLNNAIKEAEDRATEAAEAAREAAEAAQNKAEDAYDLADAATESIKLIKTQIKNQDTKLENLELRLKNVEDWVLGGKAAGLEADVEEIQKKLDAIDKDLKSIIGEYSTMVTGVSFYYTDGLTANDLGFKFTKVTQKENTFPKDDVADSKLTFKEGYTTTDEISVVVRVSPTNATLTKENISLINSQGVELTDYVECSDVKPYNDLLTRAAGGNGLWTLTFKFKDGADPDDFQDAVVADNNEQVLFAVAVNNKMLDDEARRVVSSYDMTLSAEEAKIAGNSFAMKDNAGTWKYVSEVHNRYSKSEESGASTTNIPELVWNDDTKPATSATQDNSTDRGRNGFDNRQDEEVLQATLNKAVEIKVDYDKSTGKVNNKIAGFYVTLDSKFAASQELTEWESYQYEGVGTSKQKATLFKGNEGKITIKSLAGNVSGDVIGFRLYAVNLDGRLVDPDGRAFYVAVGNNVATAAIDATDIIANATTVTSDFVEVPAGTFINCSRIDNWTNVSGAKVGNYSNVFNVTYYAEDKSTVIAPTDYNNYSKIRYVKFTMPDARNFEDGGTYTQKLNLYTQIGSGSTTTNVLTKTITATMTKVMPTKFLAENFGIKIGQNYGNDYTVRPFMQPANGWSVASPAASGSALLSDIFNGLDNRNIKFVFSGVGNVVCDDNNGTYTLTASKSVIDDKVRDLKVYYRYRDVSAVKQSNGTWKRGDLEIPYEKELKAQLSTWMYDMGYSWNISASKRTLTWKSAGGYQDLSLSNIKVTNERDNTTFGGTLGGLLDNAGKNYLSYVAGSAELVASDGSVNPYFDVDIYETAVVNNGQVEIPALTIRFTQNTTDPAQAPYSDHPETLTFKVKDVYGLVKTIELEVNVSKPE